MDIANCLIREFNRRIIHKLLTKSKQEEEKNEKINFGYGVVRVFNTNNDGDGDQVALLGSWGPYQTGLGGEFAIAPDNSLIYILDGYATATKNQLAVQTQTFQTFCLEHRRISI